MAGEKVIGRLSVLTEFKLVGAGQAKKQMRSLAGGMAKTVKSASNSTKKSFGAMIKQAASLQNLIGQMAHYIAFSIGVQMVMGIRRGIEAIIDIFKRFEKSVVNAAAVSGYLGQSFDNAVGSIKRLSIELARRTIFTLTEVGEAMYTFASAGIDPVRTSVEDLLPVLQYAQAHQVDLGEATKYVITVLKQFKIGLEDTNLVVDTFTALITNSFMTAEKMGNAFQYVGQIAGELNQDFRETAAVLTLLTNRGYTGAQAGQRLNMMFTKLIAPTEKAKKELAGLGLSLSDIDPTTHSIIDILYKLRDANFSVANSSNMFRARTAAAAATLVNAVDEIEEFNVVAKTMGGITEYIAEKQMETLDGSFKRLAGHAEELAVSFGDQLADAIDKATWALGRLISEGEGGGGFKIDILGTLGKLVPGFSQLLKIADKIQKWGRDIIETSEEWKNGIKELNKVGDDNKNMIQRNYAAWDKYNDTLSDVNRIQEQMATYITDASKDTDEYKQLVTDLAKAELAVVDAENKWIETSTKILTTLYDLGGAVSDSINAFKNYYSAYSEMIRLEDRQKSLQEELIELTNKRNEAEEGSQEYIKLTNRQTSAIAELNKVNTDLTTKTEEVNQLVRVYNDFRGEATKEEQKYIDMARQLIEIQGDLYRAQNEMNSAYTVYQHQLDILINKEKYLAEANLAVYDAEDKKYKLELKMYKLDEQRADLNEELFEQLADQGLLTEETIDLYKEWKMAQADMMKLNDDYAKVISGLTEEELALVEAFMRGENVDISGISGAETIIAMKNAMDIMTAAQDAYSSSVQDTAQHYIDVGIASNDVADTLYEIYDISNDELQLASELKLAVIEYNEALEAAQSIMAVNEQDVKDLEAEWLIAKGIVDDVVAALESIKSDYYATLHVTVVYDDEGSPTMGSIGHIKDGKYVVDAKGAIHGLKRGITETKGPTLAMIGEDGAEAVVPLEGANRKYGEDILGHVLSNYYPDLMKLQKGGVFGGGDTRNITYTSGPSTTDNFNMYGPINLNGVQNMNALMNEMKLRARTSRRY
jgi:TP901 family phage tail tape measure protein